MKMEPEPFGPGDDVKSLALGNMMGTLPKGALEDFLHAGEGGTSRNHGSITFDCEMRNGLLVPLKPCDREHPVWQEIAAVVDEGAVVGTGFVLENHLALLTEASSERPARIIALPDDLIIVSLRGKVVGRLTESEYRLLKQLICGLKLSDAADRDGVSHETKRTQFRTLSRKLGARSQNELTNKVLMHILLGPECIGHHAAESDEYFIELMREFIPEARTFQLRSESGSKHRFVDLGPIAGRPVALVHSQILPDIRPADIALLHDHGLRLIVPLRNGAMSQTSRRLDLASHLNHACEGIELVRTYFAGERIDLLLCISGCAYGIEYARRRPGSVRSLAFVGACVRPITNASTAGRLRSGLFSLAVRHWGFFSRAMEFYGRRIRNPAAFRRLMLNMFRPSRADMSIVLAEFASPHGAERGRKLFTASVESMKHDFYHQALPRWQIFPKDAFPTAFFHGAQDFIHPIEEVRSLAKSLGDLPVHAVAGAGQLLYHQHFAPLLKAYSAFLAQQ